MAKINKHQQAGKIRAKSALRDNKGRFTTNIFKREVLKTIAAKKGFDVSKDERQRDKAVIDEVIKKAGITNAELNREYKKNIDFFSDMIENGTVTTTFKNSNQIEADINSYKGKFQILRNGERINVTKTEIKLELKKFKQFIASNMNASDFSQKIKLSFDGKMILQLPDLKKFRDEHREEISELMDEMNEPDSTSMQDYVDLLTDEFDESEDIIIYVS
jgi:hypothetical protein